MQAPQRCGAWHRWTPSWRRPLGCYWIKTLPASGGLVGAVLGVFCLWIGARRAYRALFEFEAYRWMTLRLAKLAIATWVVMAMVKLVWFIQGSL